MNTPQLLAQFLRRTLSRASHRCAVLPARIAAASEPPATLDFLASNETLDRYGEVLSAEGWRLEHYRRNPVFQNAHQYGDVLFTLGRALITEVRQIDGRPGLFQRIEFAVDANPLARIAYDLYRGGFLNAVSVGFLPIRWEEGTERTPYRRKYLEQELIEVSAVGIPANPEALRLGLAASGAAADFLNCFHPAPGRGSGMTEAGETPARQTCFPDHSTKWLQLARALRDVLGRE